MPAPHRSLGRPGIFATETDRLLFDLAEVILIQVNTVSATTHEELYKAIDRLTPEHVAAAKEFAGYLERAKANQAGRVLSREDVSRMLRAIDRIAREEVQ